MSDSRLLAGSIKKYAVRGAAAGCVFALSLGLTLDYVFPPHNCNQYMQTHAPDYGCTINEGKHCPDESLSCIDEFIRKKLINDERSSFHSSSSLNLAVGYTIVFCAFAIGAGIGAGVGACRYYEQKKQQQKLPEEHYIPLASSPKNQKQEEKPGCFSRCLSTLFNCKKRWLEPNPSIQGRIKRAPGV